MRKVVLFIATSVDGYIADVDGGVSWLGGQDAAAEMPDTYSSFVEGVDTVVMGWNTYWQIVTELSPDRWVYEGLQSYVVTHRELSSTPQITFTAEDPVALVKRLRQGVGKDIWICGGAEMVRQLLAHDLIDRFHLSVIPVVLGQGIRLFGERGRRINLRLTATQHDNGIVEMIYERRPEQSVLG